MPVARRSTLDRGLITASIMLTTIMPLLDTTIANVALPSMQGNLSATRDQINWVLTSYIVATAIMTAPAGALAARLGRRRVFVVAVVGFTVASMLCGAASSLVELVLFRVLQGGFGAALVPLSQAVLLDTYPREKHASAMAVWGLGVMVGPILGPTLGGYITEFYDWRWIFYINLPLGILALLGILAFVPETPRHAAGSFDYFGFIALCVAIGALQLMLDRGESQDWFASTEIVVEAVAAALFLYMFLVHMFTTRHPFLEPGLFWDRNFAFGLILVFVVGVVHLGTLVLLPPFLQNLMGFPALTTGYVIAPRGLGTMVGLILVSRAARKIDGRLLILFGMIFNAFSLWELSGFTAEVPVMTIVWTGFVQGLGLGFVFVPLSTMAFATLAPRYRTEGTAMFSLMRNIGGSIGISVVVTLLTQDIQVAHMEIANGLTPFHAALHGPWLPGTWDWRTAAGVAALDGEVTRQAATIAFLNDFTLLMWLAVLSTPLLLLVPKAKPQKTATAFVED